MLTTRPRDRRFLLIPIVFAILGGLLPVSLSAQSEPPPLTDAQIDFQMRNRLSFGPRLGELPGDPAAWRAWVDRQLDPTSIDDAACEERIRTLFPSMAMSISEAYAAYWPLPPEGFDELPQEQKDLFFADRNQRFRRLQLELRESVLYRAVLSERQFQEVIVEFWRNHLNIDQTKGDCRFFANHYEETVIRQHAFGRFEDLLLASARHPAMLVYLDNDVSQKPLTKEELRQLELIRQRRLKDPNARLGDFARALERQTGLNENYARELMELHTLGVDNYYEQRDVYELARVLTGWTHGWEGEPYASEYGFRFQADVHDDGSKRVLGSKIRKKDGEKEGIETIRRLAHHPGTAEYVTWKLCRYLVNDEPDPGLLARVTEVFRDTKGDLPAVYRAIVLDPEFIHPRNHRAKFKSPFEFVVSVLRVTGAEIHEPRGVLLGLHRMGQPLYQCEDPTGYFDQTEAWLDPGVLVHRWDFALKLTSGKLQGVKMHPEVLPSLIALESSRRLDTIQRSMLPVAMTPEDRAGFDHAQSAPYLLGLVLGSPAFQEQ